MGQSRARSVNGGNGAGHEASFDTPETLRLHNSSPAVYLPPSIGGGMSRAGSLVGLPKVILIIDGDEVSDMGWPGYPMPVRRKALVDNVAQLCSSTNATAQIVFDAGVSKRCPHSRRDQSVEVRLAAAMVSPAAAISELTERHSNNRPLVVVSSNPTLTQQGNHRAEVMTATELLDLFLQ